MTRARDELHLLQPQRFYRQNQGRHSDGHALAPASRFLTDAVVAFSSGVRTGRPTSRRRPRPRAHRSRREPDLPSPRSA
ncbi:hypothetical protein CKO28_15895 [Rhodovibrio sodomensis]|uniref:Uncharacterized protein n=1 Tax=Rhodovibrio sodomensis TaxID=1088 RepID=A0ABS1DGB8_9PROT|nr:hypothetical protein [Rhodovibrio sodomensis]